MVGFRVEGFGDSCSRFWRQRGWAFASSSATAWVRTTDNAVNYNVLVVLLILLIQAGLGFAAYLLNVPAMSISVGAG